MCDFRCGADTCHFQFELECSCILFVPVDVIKERMQIQKQMNISAAGTSSSQVYYKSSLDAIRTIARAEGVRGVYRGYAATLMSFGPFSALYFTFYEEVTCMSCSMFLATLFSCHDSVFVVPCSLSWRQRSSRTST